MDLHEHISDPALSVVRDMEASSSDVAQGTPVGAVRYQYAPLSSSQTIRLVQMVPAAGIAGPAKLKFLEVSLDNAPEYIALSYHWGDPAPACEWLYLDGKSLLLTNSVDEFLSHFARDHMNQLFWIDALCINQENIEEKQDQIAMMGDIYKRSSKVLVWLGLPNRHIINAFAAFRHLEPVFRGYRINNRWALETMSYDSWRDIARLLNRPWFCRLWVVQEVMNGPSVELRCGNLTLSWDMFELVIMGLNEWNAMSTISVGEVFSPGRMGAMGLINIRNARIEGLQRSLQYILGLTIKRLASDHRDKVYGALGLCSGKDATAVKIDYGADLDQVLINLARYVLLEGTETNDRHSPMSLLSLAGTGFPRTLTSVPSWVPTLEPIPRPTMLGYMAEVANPPRSASRGLAFPAKSLESSRTITLSGIVVDTITTVALAACDPVDWSSRSSFLLNAERVAKTLSATRELNAGLWEMFWRTLTVNVCLGGGPTDAPPSLYGIGLAYLLKLAKAGRPGTTLTQEASEVSSALDTHAYLRSFFVTESKRMGLGMYDVQAGDIVCILSRGPVPYILRKVNRSTADGNCFEFVGECYIHGLMDGEGVTRRSVVEKITLC